MNIPNTPNSEMLYKNPLEIVKRIRKDPQLGKVPIKRILAALKPLDLSQGLTFPEIIEKILPSLRAQGLKDAGKLELRDANEGLVAICNSPSSISIVGVSCGSDFVARAQKMQDFASKLAEIASKNNINNLESLLSAKYENNSIADQITQMRVEFGENISAFEVYTTQKTQKTSVGFYIHNQFSTVVGTECAIVKLNQPNQEKVASDIALHIVGTHTTPIIIDAKDAPKEMIDKECAAIEQQNPTSNPNIPSEKAEMIKQKRLEARIKELSLLSQPYIKSEKTSIADHIRACNPELSVVEFHCTKVK